eukprot:TRINITY_DN31357_c0_g1_i2.p1 TRINITY_DN31357_c0_g1~~TRINITY_DN31357_c0_g1_i2.p1  ORF type:complete len:254 (-),score=57.63 TRINITY_DN31357_c0_g1_i2:11-772(-)
MCIRDSPDAVDFTLLNQLINEGKMTLNEAIVLLTRERALLIDDVSNTFNQGASVNSSFISRAGAEFLDHLREIKDDSQLHENSSLGSERFDDKQRSRSMTPNRVSLVRLINRLSWRLGLKNTLEIKEEDELAAVEDKKKEILEKQLKADMIRKNAEVLKQDFINKDKQRMYEVRERNAERITKQKESFIKRLDSADQRYEAQLNNKRKRAKDETTKAQEIAFITMLENQNKNCLLYTSPSPRDGLLSRMPSSA